jgi:lycopene beta-cyclase
MDHFQYLLLMAACLVLTAPLELLGARVYRQPGRLVRTVAPVVLAFLAWDACAVAAGVWTYNPRYITGLTLPFIGVPVEELVFFVVVPTCAILTYEAVQVLLGRGEGR